MIEFDEEGAVGLLFTHCTTMSPNWALDRNWRAGFSLQVRLEFSQTIWQTSGQRGQLDNCGAAGDEGGYLECKSAPVGVLRPKMSATESWLCSDSAFLYQFRRGIFADQIDFADFSEDFGFFACSVLATSVQ